MTVDPQLVLLDEPFASLDASLRSTVRDDVARILRDAGTTAVLVTHDQEEAFSMADRVAIIRAGQITPTAPPQTFYSHPLDPDMAAFVGEANLLTGTIDGPCATTVLGPLPIRGDAAGIGPATVLVRPEQVELIDGDETGVAGRVVRSDYHGHDVLVTVRPEGRGSDEVIVARVEGTRIFAVDAVVTLRAHGSVLAWPIDNAAPDSPG